MIIWETCVCDSQLGVGRVSLSMPLTSEANLNNFEIMEDTLGILMNQVTLVFQRYIALRW